MGPRQGREGEERGGRRLIIRKSTARSSKGTAPGRGMGRTGLIGDNFCSLMSNHARTEQK